MQYFDTNGGSLIKLQWQVYTEPAWRQTGLPKGITFIFSLLLSLYQSVVYSSSATILFIAKRIPAFIPK